MSYFEPQHYLMRITERVDKSVRFTNYSKLKNLNTNQERLFNNFNINKLGMLAGTLVCKDIYTGDLKPCLTENDYCLGVLAEDSDSPNDLQNRSNYSAIYLGGIFQTLLYETVSYSDNSTILNYKIGDTLYVSPYGTVTNEKGLLVNRNRPIGIVLRINLNTKKLTYKLFDTILETNSDSIPNPDYVLKSDIVDNLNSVDPLKPLSAKQGNYLFNLIGELRIKTFIVKLNLQLIQQGYFDLPETPLFKEDVRIAIRTGSVQMNYWSNGYSSVLGPADFSVGTKLGENLNRIYFRSDGGLGGYDSTDLVDGVFSPEGLPIEGSILIVEYQQG